MKNLYEQPADSPVWYLAHPIAPDARFTYEQNIAHVVHMIKLCYKAGVRVIAPYHTLCMAFEDSNPEERRVGLEVDCEIVRRLRRLILVGHKVSSGMLQERIALHKNSGVEIDLTNLSDDEVFHQLSNSL